MKWLIVLVVFVSTAQAQVPDLAMRGQFDLPRGLVKTVVVQGYGETPALARHDAFRTAIEHVAGVAVVSETQVHNWRIQRDQTATYSQAHVSSFHILTMSETARGWTTQMWVTVRSACERGSYNCTN
jgi:hypothetical protein